MTKQSKRFLPEVKKLRPNLRRKKCDIPFYESLEPRHLLAVAVSWDLAVAYDDLQATNELSSKNPQLDSVDHFGVSPTHFYQDLGQRREMMILSDRIVAERNTTVLDQQTASLLAQYGVEKSRPLDDSHWVFSTTQSIHSQLVDQLLESGWANRVVPVFGVIETASEAVLLNEVIVKLDADTQPEQFFSMDRFESFRRLDGTFDQYIGVLRNDFGERALAVVDELNSQQGASWVAPNFHQNWQRHFIPNDPRFSNLWHLHNTGQGGGMPGIDSNLPDAWAINPGGSSNIVIGMVDDGVAIDHPDLFNWVNPGEIAGNNIDDDGNGWVDDIYGWNFVVNNNVSYPVTPFNNHGTAAAGVAAARGDNGIGVAGAAYNSPVLSAAIFRGQLVTTDAGIASAIYYASGRTRDGSGTWDAAHIVNHSWGSGSPNPAITEAIEWASSEARGGLGVLQVFASGNTNGNVSYPARLSATLDGVMAVGAINNFGEKSNYSNFGAELDIVTPSSDTRPGYLAIDTTDRVGLDGFAPGDYTGIGVTGFGGTSSAASLASGIAALALSSAQEIDLQLTAADLKKLIRNNTKLAGPDSYNLDIGRNSFMGYGLLDAATLVRGIGKAQINLVSADGVLDHNDTVIFGETFLNETNDLRFRIRNQGTEPLNLIDFSSSTSSFEVVNLGQSVLQIGESTTFAIRFMPQLDGIQTGEISIFSNDADLPEFKIQVEGIGVALTVSGTVFEDRNGNEILDQGEQGLEDWLVFLDSNGNGQLDANNQSYFFSNNNRVRIYDFQTTTSSILVSNVVETLTRINVVVNISHNYVSDLDIVLVAPNGMQVLLFENEGEGGINLVNTIFSDTAVQSINQGAAPFSGAFRPQQPLSRLNNIDPNGQWQLMVTDSVAGDQGFLNSWRIEFFTGEQFAFTNDLGEFGFAYADIGTYEAIVVPPSGWTLSGSNSQPVAISHPTSRVTGVNFGAGKNDRFYGHVFNDINGNGTVDPGEQGLANRNLFLDNDFDGLPDETELNFFNFTETPILDLTTVESTILVENVPGVVGTVEITVNIEHTWVSDMIITLEAPDGTEILLFNQRGENGEDLINTTFADDAEIPIEDGEAPFTGRFRPERGLFGLRGGEPNGDWKLKIEDVAEGDDGLLLDWNLTLNYFELYETDADGWFVADLTSEFYNFQLQETPNWSFTNPSSGSIRVFPEGQPFFNQTFGTRQNVAFVSRAHAFYPGSSFSSGGIMNSVDLNKFLAKQGEHSQTLSYDNLLNTTFGINGLFFEVDFLASQSLQVSDFEFRMSPTGAFVEADHPPEQWELAPDPSSINVVGLSGNRSRIFIQWPNNVIQNRWLSTTIKANSNTGVLVDETYFLGHLLGEVNGQTVDGVYYVTIADALTIANLIGPLPVSISDFQDLNKDGFISSADIIAMQAAIGNNRLRNITIPGTTGGSQGRLSDLDNQDDNKFDSRFELFITPDARSDSAMGRIESIDVTEERFRTRWNPLNSELSMQLKLPGFVNVSNAFLVDGMDKEDSQPIAFRRPSVNLQNDGSNTQSKSIDRFFESEITDLTVW